MADDIEDAVETALSEKEQRNFTESVDLAINLRDLDLSQPDNRVDEEVVLPAGTGRDIKVGVFADGETAVRAEDEADEVIRPDELADLSDDDAKDLAGEIDFFIGEQDMMQDVASSLGSVLGPRGKMPNPLEPDEVPLEVVHQLL
ncbi:MAG: 50S ribosomal protein L1, partial [Halobacteria archaeon]|nr:50S ribosomal protein L1 [Halobacteria archaeon]